MSAATKPRARRPSPQLMDVEAARAVLAAARDAEERQRLRGLRKYVGRFFRYHNSYSSSERWWLYGAVTGVEKYQGCVGWSFQKTAVDHIEIDLRARIQPNNGGWIEIPARELWAEAKKLSAAVVAQLKPRGRG